MDTLRAVLAASLALSFATTPVRAESEAYAKSVSARTLLRTARTSGGGALDFPKGDSGEVAALEVTIPAYASTGWHVHAHSGFAYVVQGTLQVQTADSAIRVFHAGDAFAEVVGTPHNGTATAGDVKLIAFFLVDSGKAVSTKSPHP